ncbi:peroxisomal membrane protein 2-like [Ruditapes philippinarum]|uniref:peroxisomal membrane protein 2-like n=1 Tax=Ruditapes philippinarum TaxID=129788 RepID=UPI00295B6CCC|nr:peroxisomal membrane protein 2-like [Ruditapes philippinarum]
MSLSKESKENFFESILNKYLKLLKEKPLITKCCTSASVSALGNFISQKVAPHPDGKVKWRSVASYATFAFCLSAPIIHYFYMLLEKIQPRKEKPSQIDNIKRLLIDRFLFTPPFILLFLYVVTILEGQGSAVAMEKIRTQFWTILKMNWKVWTIFTFINVNYIPVRYRVLFGNMVGLFWSVFVAVKRRQMGV